LQDIEEMVVAMAGAKKEDKSFQAAISKAKEMQKDSQDDFVSLFGQAFSDIAPGVSLAPIFYSRDSKEKFTLKLTNEEVLEIIKGEADAAVSRTRQVLPADR